MSELDKFLVTLDLANNHMGDVKKGLKIIRDHHKVLKEYKMFFNFAFKFQYRQLKTFIHPNFKDDHSYKYVKRFQETELSNKDYLVMKREVEKLGYLTMCTPFDNDSVDIIEKHKFDILKIASCSFTDWSLLNRVAETDVSLPIVISCAGATLEDIDKVVLFLQNRNRDFMLMHCVAEYPTEFNHLELNQIDLLKERYPGVRVGFSSHADPEEVSIVQMAIAKGVKGIERHIDTNCNTRNMYSSTPEDIDYWLSYALEAFAMCGESKGRYKSTEGEMNALNGLKRGVWLKKNIKKGDKIKRNDVFCAIPIVDENQLIADDMSKYNEYTAKEDMVKNEALYKDDVDCVDVRQNVLEIVRDVKKILVDARIALPNKIEMQLSHHYGLNNFRDVGAVILNFINNEEYCKKLLILFPEQSHPSHFHILKHESFNILYGEMTLNYKEDDKDKVAVLKSGDIFVVDRNIPHSFESKTGCIFEEVSTQSISGDSYYEDDSIATNKDRKTDMVFYSDWLEKELK